MREKIDAKVSGYGSDKKAKQSEEKDISIHAKARALYRDFYKDEGLDKESHKRLSEGLEIASDEDESGTHIQKDEQTKL